MFLGSSCSHAFVTDYEINVTFADASTKEKIIFTDTLLEMLSALWRRGGAIISLHTTHTAFKSYLYSTWMLFWHI